MLIPTLIGFAVGGIKMKKAKAKMIVQPQVQEQTTKQK